MAKFEKKYTIEEVRNLFLERGCELLETEYKNCVTPMSYKCSCGVVAKTRLSSFLEGCRCKECGYKKIRQSRTLSYDEVVSVFAKAGYKVLDKEYTKNSIPINVICDKGHASSINYNNFRRGGRCKQCFIDSISGENSPNYNPNREEVANNEKFRRLCRSLVRRTVKLLGTEKIKRSEEILGYKHCELMDHLKSHPNMGLIGPEDKWVVDHKFPIKAFIDYGIDDISLINCLDNLQPLEEKVNLKKNDKYSKEEFEEFLRAKGIRE